jgi:MoaA/NifB/PqqE/SkfB family radical SAM enzyme
MTTNQVFTVIDALAKAGVSFLYITGGEPLIREDIVEILRYIKKKKMYVLLGTNGSLLLEKFDKIRNYVDRVHISIKTIRNFEKIAHSTKEIFIDVCESIKLLKKEKIPTQINVTIDKNNINEMLDIFEFLNKSFSHLYVQFSPMELLSPDKEDNEQMKCLLPDINLFNKNLLMIKNKYNNKLNCFDTDIKILKNKYSLMNKELCKAGNNMLVINSNGELNYPCEFLNLENIKINSKDDIKLFLDKTDKKFFYKKKVEFCRNCIDPCYVQSSYFLTIKGFLSVIKNMLFKQ